MNVRRSQSKHYSRREFILVAAAAGCVLRGHEARAQTSEAPPARKLDWLPSSQLVTAAVCEVNRHDGIKLLSRDGVEMAQRNGPAAIVTPGGKWEVAVTSRPLDYHAPQLGGGPDRAEPSLGRCAVFRFRLAAGESPESSVGLAFHLANWSEDVYCCMPGAVYRGNRFRAYPNVGWYGHYAQKDLGPKADQIIANIPRLSITKGGPSAIQSMLTRSLTTPAIGIWNPQLKEALFLMTDQGAPFGDSLIEITENPEHTDAWIRFASPGVRQTKLYTGNHVDRGHDFRTGDTVDLKVMAFSFACEDMATFFAHLFAIRKLEMPDRAELPGLTFSRAMVLQRNVIDMRWSEKHRIFSDDKNGAWYFQVGSCGGMMKDYPIYALDFERSGGRVRQAMESYNKGWSPSGLMFGRCTPAGEWLGDCDRPGFPAYEKHMTMTERQGEALLYLIKTTRLIRHREPTWKASESFSNNLKRQADTLCRTFEKYGQLGQYLDIRTGDVFIGGSTNAASTPSGLVAAWREFGDRRYLETAKALADQLYNDHAVRGNFHGSCADILQSPDSQGPAVFLPSMMDLYAATGDADYLKKARHVAWHLASWIKNCDYDFTREFPQCTFARMNNLKTVGAYWASAQNLVGTPGLCVSSGLPLLELYRFDGDIRYLELLRDITHCVFRAVGRPELRKQFPGTRQMSDGWIAERFSTTDMFTIGGGVGEFWNVSTPWCATTLMLICLEIPSLYAVTDRQFVYPFDTVQVGAVRRTANGLDVQLTNPTDFPATYTVLVDKTTDGAKPLPEFFFERFQRFEFAPRETRVVHLAEKPSGHLVREGTP